MNTRKNAFTTDFERARQLARKTRDVSRVTVIAVAVELPSGAIEIIQNHEEIQLKFAYYKDAYDSDMRLKANLDVRIVSWMFV